MAATVRALRGRGLSATAAASSLDLRLEGHRAARRDGGAHAPRAGARGAVDATSASSPRGTSTSSRELRHALARLGARAPRRRRLSARGRRHLLRERPHEGRASAGRSSRRALGARRGLGDRDRGPRRRAGRHVVALGGRARGRARCSRSCAASKARAVAPATSASSSRSRPTARSTAARGILEGRIAEEPSGTAGFGFDPVFIPEGEEQTVAELGDDWKREQLPPRPRRASAPRSAQASPAASSSCRRLGGGRGRATS